MKNPLLYIFLICIATMQAVVSPAIAQSEPPTEDSAAGGAPQQGVAASSPDDQFRELGLEDIESAFTRETVLKLNAIVSRSLDTVTRYDDEIPKIEMAVEMATGPDADGKARSDAEAGLALLATLSEQASAAHADMLVASEQVRTSGEKFNAPLLSGMNRFVRRVDEEILEKLQALKAKMKTNAVQ